MTIFLNLSQTLKSKTKDEYVCLLSYSNNVKLLGKVAEAYPFDENEQSCQVRVSEQYGYIERLAIGFRLGEAFLSELVVGHPILPLILFDVPSIAF